MFKRAFQTTLLVFGIAMTVNGQQASKIEPGVVLSISSDTISMQTISGTVEVRVGPATEYKRVSAASPSFKTAVPASKPDIQIGDKILAIGAFATDKRSISATTVFLMSQTDIAKKNEKERQEWRTRGLVGRVVAVDHQNARISITTLGTPKPENIIVALKEKALVRRYAPGSIRFSEAVPSSLAEIKEGDRLNVLGEKGADQTTFAAEEIVSGSFKTVGGTVSAIDAAKGEIAIKELGSGRTVTIAVKENSTLKTFPPELARSMSMGPHGGSGVMPAGNGTPTGAPPSQSKSTMAGTGASSSPREFDALFATFPTITVSDLKVGDAIAILTTSNAGGGPLVAIKLVSGVESFFKSQISTGPRGNAPGLSIPGLDGMGSP